MQNVMHWRAWQGVAVSRPHACDQVLFSQLYLGGEEPVNELEGKFKIQRGLLATKAPPIGGGIGVYVDALACEDVNNDLHIH